MLLLRAPSLEATRHIAAGVAAQARRGDTIVLSGEMGAGKTAFAQGIGAALGIDGPMTSPTYTLVHSYELPPGPRSGPRSLHHADLYRLSRTTEVFDLGLDELAEYDGVVLVEWGDVLEGAFADHLEVHLERDLTGDGADDTRVIEISSRGSSWASRWGAIVTAVEGYSC